MRPWCIRCCLRWLRRLNQDALRDSRVAVVNSDAFQFLRQGREQFDCVIIDLPDPHSEALSKLYSVEFYKLLLRRLAPGGLIVSQSASPLLTKETFWAIGQTMGGRLQGLPLSGQCALIFRWMGLHLGWTC
jgi:spermidine synthase